MPHFYIRIDKNPLVTVDEYIDRERLLAIKKQITDLVDCRGISEYSCWEVDDGTSEEIPFYVHLEVNFDCIQTLINHGYITADDVLNEEAFAKLPAVEIDFRSPEEERAEDAQYSAPSSSSGECILF
jgi:hypothetical protein